MPPDEKKDSLIIKMADSPWEIEIETSQSLNTDSVGITASHLPMRPVKPTPIVQRRLREMKQQPFNSSSRAYSK